MQVRAEAYGAWIGYVGPTKSQIASRTFEDAYIGYYPDIRSYTLHRLGKLGASTIIRTAYESLPEEVAAYLYFDYDTYESRLPVFVSPSEYGGVHVFDELAYPQDYE